MKRGTMFFERDGRIQPVGNHSGVSRGARPGFFILKTTDTRAGGGAKSVRAVDAAAISEWRYAFAIIEPRCNCA